ncbi:glycosyltransferase family 2 protein [Prevotella sp. kh1p2]|uniref:glycosyltransferase family 2 protein n=1 Tax=Prevotella sp. kh1p2 TaxID=1761883 RepID=UPI000B834A29|nr:glycosyltransferase family 2 protein [Prevotella sp. kh1p2]
MISVIIPVYNICKKKCQFLSAVRSIQLQSTQDWELLLVNDGSTDKTAQILQSLQEKDSRIRIISKSNGGVESARREGLHQAQGEYILHMDQDDVYRVDALQIMTEKMSQSQADVLIGNYARFIFDYRLTFGEYHSESMSTEKLIIREEFMNRYYKSFFGINDLPVNIWNKLYRRSFIESVPEPPLTGQIIEDLSYNMHVLPYAQKIYILPEVLYYYRWGGFTSRYDTTLVDTALVGYQFKMNEIKKYNLPELIRSVSIEFLNYINSYFFSIVLYENVPTETFCSRAEAIALLPEMKEVELYMRENEIQALRFAHINYMLSHDWATLYSYEKQQIKNNRLRYLLKKILLRI